MRKPSAGYPGWRLCIHLSDFRPDLVPDFRPDDEIIHERGYPDGRA